ncbi:tRNA dimethylallyltransferase, mitochondrial [Melipona quadrifasciata]|uniref:tRNA dimethylallyltransferase, mitochondrial n=1 Tax=Melipona quadrifasciata TaxID=166423 RepID=A0A0M9A3R9_9HYME|nr:tRNA dimethylallyltransferase, mitochondrial [Melipona quadrifasciata]
MSRDRRSVRIADDLFGGMVAQLLYSKVVCFQFPKVVGCRGSWRCQGWNGGHLNERKWGRIKALVLSTSKAISPDKMFSNIYDLYLCNIFGFAIITLYYVRNLSIETMIETPVQQAYETIRLTTPRTHLEILHRSTSKQPSGGESNSLSRSNRLDFSSPGSTRNSSQFHSESGDHFDRISGHYNIIFLQKISSLTEEFKEFSLPLTEDKQVSYGQSLDILTAKVTEEEKKMAAHHMLDIVDPVNPSYTVVQFRNTAAPIINDLLARRKLPIIVGGTNYYIESVLWEILIDKDRQPMDEVDDASRSKRMKVELDRSTTRSNEELYQELTRVDPEMAKTFHPNNRRKIIRSTEFPVVENTLSELAKTNFRNASGHGCERYYYCEKNGASAAIFCPVYDHYHAASVFGVTFLFSEEIVWSDSDFDTVGVGIFITEINLNNFGKRA